MSHAIGFTHATNFGPFEDLEIDFSKPGLSLVDGQIDGVPGSTSNGAGKSFLFDAPLWALFGRCARPGYDGDNVIRHGAVQGAVVEVNVVPADGGDKVVKVCRYRKHPLHKDKVFLFVDGSDVTRGTNAQTQLAIENEIGFDFLGAINSVAFGAREDVKSFFTAPDSERKAVLEKILGLELYAEAEKVARRRLTELARELQVLEGDQLNTQGRLSEQKAIHASLVTGEVSEDSKVTLLEQQAIVRKLRRAIEKAEAHVIEAANDYAEIEALVSAADEERSAKMTEIDAARAVLTTAIRKIEMTELPMRGAELDRIAAQRKQLTGMSAKGCPTCGQEIEKGHATKLCAGYDEQVVLIQAKVAALKLQSADKRGELVVIDDLPEVDRSPLEGVTAHLDAKTTRVDRLKQLLDNAVVRLDSMTDVQEEQEARAAESLARINELDDELAKRADKQAIVQREADRTQFWMEAFGNSGLKSFLIEAEIPEINRRASVYAQRLLGQGAYVRLCATKQLKTKAIIREELTVEACIPGLTKTYAGASKGQKKRLDLSLLLAFRDIVSSRNAKSFKQLFADELFDGVDAAGVETVAAMLKEVSADCPVLLVTHNERLKNLGDRSYLIHHDGTRATLVARGAESATKGPKRKAGTK